MNIFIGGCIVGIFVSFFVMFSTNNHFTEAYAAIVECQKNLPRNMYCKAVITAEVVENKK